jgi:GAF domain-containing protein
VKEEGDQGHDRRINEGLIPICGWCKKIKTEQETWEDIEVYFRKRGLGEFTHSMCPSCSEEIFSKRIYLESYQNICKLISTSLALNEVLNLIVTSMVKVMNVKACSLRLLNSDTQELELAAYHGLSEKYANKGPVEYDGSIEDALAGKPVSVYDITTNRDARYSDEAIEEGIRTILSIPLRLKGEVIGVMRMYTADPIEYSGEDLKFLSAIAEQAAIAIVNARFFEKTLSKEKEYLRVFQKVTKMVSSSLQLSEVLDTIVRILPEVMGVKAATIRLLDEEGNRLLLVAASGLSEQYLKRGPVDMEKNIQEALRERPVAIHDVSTDSRVFYKKEAELEGIKSMLTLPVISRGKVIGILRLLTSQPKHFSHQDIGFAAALAEQCGIAIENARMYETQYREVTYLQAIQDISKAITSTLSLQEVMNLIVERIAVVMKTEASTIWLLKRKQQLELVAFYGLSPAYLSKEQVDAEKSITDALYGTPVAIYDATSDPRTVHKEEARKEGIGSILVIPMMFRGNVIGVLRVLTKGYNKTFGTDDVEFATAIAEQAAIAIEYAKAFSY